MWLEWRPRERKRKIAVHLVRNTTSAIKGIVSPPFANLEIIVRQREKRKIKTTTEHAESTSSDDEVVSQAEHLAQAKKMRQIGKDDGYYRSVVLRLNDVDVVMEADSGADVNIMDEHQFKAFIHRTNDKPTITNSYVKLRSLHHKLEVKGQFQKVIRNPRSGKATQLWYLKKYINPNDQQGNINRVRNAEDPTR